MQRSQNLREKIVAVFSRYLEQAHVRVAPNDGSKRCISLFLHDPENRDHPIQKRPDARGIRIRMALHAANFVHQNQITVLRIRQRGQSRRLKRIRKRRDAERRAADADAVMRIAEQILCCGRMQINRPAAIRLRLCRDSAESPKPLRFDGIQCSSNQRTFSDLHGAGQKDVHRYPSPRGFFAVPDRFARCKIISAAIDTAISAGVCPRISRPIGA